MAVKRIFDFSKGKKGPLKNFIIGGIGAISGLYLINLSWGGLEFLPDALPFIGNLDEATATLLLLASMRYFGIDVLEMFTGVGKSEKEEKEEYANNEAPPKEPRYEPPTS
ncbi:MAG: DUF1232 domain-containing protein [Candidatus Caenarcaniphilales bacterium]|nr:DUF1232 domain-containing protein [Candidatus Caenarcaniphilales bacterium]